MYAEGTTVSAEKSKMEIDRVLRKYGAKNIVVTIDDDDNEIVVAFVLLGRSVRLKRALPSLADKAIKYDHNGHMPPFEFDLREAVEQ